MVRSRQAHADDADQTEQDRAIAVRRVGDEMCAEM